jgi:hypothetical protein
MQVSAASSAAEAAATAARTHRATGILASSIVGVKVNEVKNRRRRAAVRISQRMRESTMRF